MDIKPASDYPTPDLGQLMNLSFEEYIVPIRLDDAQFQNMLRKDAIDLPSSRVLLVEGEPAGIALIAHRGSLRASRLAAMGLKKDLRGQGLGKQFMEKLIQDARDRKDQEMVLEVIEQNEPAVRLYQGFGFKTVRRLIGLVHQPEKQVAKSDFQEVNLREMGALISQHGLPDLPWQLSGETIALMDGSVCAYKHGEAYITISNPDAEHIVIWSLLVEPSARGKGLAVDMLERVIAHHAGKVWHVPAIWPEEFGILFERAGFKREEISQKQMKLSLDQAAE
ncbi:MAG TPA: GNAT family N-acetyltransferase [Anaerolineales bacterium]|nr:GNAT family N-acetyltransferase [Anaerolineales bacterium]